MNKKEINSFNDALDAINLQFNTLEVLITMHELETDITNELQMIENRFDEIFEKGKNFGLTDEMIDNVVKKYNRMKPVKTDKI